jgi:hypothetical protein
MERVAAWHREKVTDSHEQQINRAWRQHRAYLKNLDHGNAAPSAGVSRDNNQNGRWSEEQERG